MIERVLNSNKLLPIAVFQIFLCIAALTFYLNTKNRLYENFDRQSNLRKTEIQEIVYNSLKRGDYHFPKYYIENNVGKGNLQFARLRLNEGFTLTETGDKDSYQKNSNKPFYREIRFSISYSATGQADVVVALHDQEKEESLNHYIKEIFLVYILVNMVFFTVNFYWERKKKEASMAREQASVLQEANDQLNQEVVTKNKLYEEMLVAKVKAEKAQHAREEFFAAVSHEIKTPLAAIAGVVAQLGKDGCGEGEKQNLMGIFHSNLSFLTSHLNDVLDLSKLKTSQFEINKARVNLLMMLKEIATLFEIQATKKNLSFMVNLYTEIPADIYTDHKRFHQVLGNIIGNAIKFCDKGGISIGVSYSSGVGTMELFVTDTGIGIQESARAHIFEEYAQESPEISQRFGGSGLGLSLARSLAQSLGGDVRLVESFPGIGSCFRVEIPVGIHRPRVIPKLEAQKRLKAVPEPIVVADKGEKKVHSKKILFAEDNTDVAYLVNSVLVKKGYSVEVVDDGEQAVNAIDTRVYDLVILDIGLPKIDGIQVARYAKTQNLPYPVIGFTARKVQGEKEKLKRDGFDEVYCKTDFFKCLGEIEQNYLS